MNACGYMLLAQQVTFQNIAFFKCVFLCFFGFTDQFYILHQNFHYVS